MQNTTKKVAVFIDAENIAALNAEQIFDVASNYGDVIIKKIYGDWSKPSIFPWKEKISDYSIVAEQQFSFASGKNSSDISLIIQVMLALFEKDIDVFCIVSADSDFTRMVQELRERKRIVIGMGGRNSIQSFVNAFSEYIYLGEDNNKPQDKKTKVKKSNTDKNSNKNNCILEPDKLKILKEIIEDLIENNGRALYSQISSGMKNKYSDFVPKNYNCKSLKDFIDKLIPYLDDYKKGIDKDKTTLFLERK